MKRTTARLTGIAGALVAGTLLLAGCSGDDSDATSQTSTSSGPAGASTSAAADHNDADVAFASDMIPHHGSAIVMAQMAQDQAADQRVKDLAARIEAAQDPEIETMSGWLADWGAASSSAADDGMGGMDHGDSDDEGMDDGGMGAMDTDALSGMSGAEFDRMFLTMMIEHHRGAVEMAETELSNGRNADAITLAESIRDSQNAEIAEMEQLLTELGG
ncbi:Uncharacterized conserved protein, DUF305 family [Blastococcus aggregatus]|uniref:Uncharacterized conserved protein, DUF305 family n=1 Tax=Blastococcus aggregatus TaxID=38502 RepID=A0A285V808_9ACTN|nr:DUF305 domain-containing protein [Blastococcus aggregatus]SOC50153.1 Uncharacterized conserved protein, DUF305 family [Blastococcus aggregatus]